MFDPAFPNSVVSDNTGRCVAMVVPRHDGDLPAYRCVRVGVRGNQWQAGLCGPWPPGRGDPVLRRGELSLARATASVHGPRPGEWDPHSTHPWARW